MSSPSSVTAGQCQAIVNEAGSPTIFFVNDEVQIVFPKGTRITVTGKGMQYTLDSERSAT